MKLTVREVAKMFDASERAIERWLRDDGMPHETVHGQRRFHRADLLEWATRRGIRLASDAASSVRGIPLRTYFSDALAAGGVHEHVAVADRESALRALVDRMRIDDPGDRDLLFEVLLARENAGSTGVGDGIAIPHVRHPVVLDVDAASITLCYLEPPIEFGAIDGKPVHTIFAIVAPTARAHLTLLARLAGVLHDPEFRRAVLDRTPGEALLPLARAAELRFAAANPSADEPMVAGNGSEDEA